ncbi:MAG: hypothetical protein PVF77_13370 [Anaerolineae bacterium]|jgi:hypothetical protein
MSKRDLRLFLTDMLESIATQRLSELKPVLEEMLQEHCLWEGDEADIYPEGADSHG